MQTERSDLCPREQGQYLARINRSRCRSRWENLDRGQYPFQPVKFVNLVVPSPCETEPYDNLSYRPASLG